MISSDKLSCLIIGEGTLPVQCIEILLEAGHTISGVVSADVSLLQWAAQKNIPQLKINNNQLSPADLVAWLGQSSFGYLFSIANEAILPPSVLALPQRGAINYHDGPLPAYAGNYPTSWAILQRETTYAVTWHMMTPQINAGDILKQSPVEIAAGETALTLNTRCYDAAIRTFSELVDDLARGPVAAYPQNLTRHTYFGRCQKPPAGCLISWQQPAADIETLVRALHFGPYPNPLGYPKFTLDAEFLLVSEAEIFNAKIPVPPGTITYLGPDFLQVASATYQVLFRRLLTVDGQPLSLPDVVAQFGLHEGYQLPDLDPATGGRISAIYAALCPHESFWVKRLAAAQPVSLPYMERTAALDLPARRAGLPLPIPTEVIIFLRDQQPSWRLSDFLLAAWVAYLARLNGIGSFDLGFKPMELKRNLAGLESLFSATVPLHFELDLLWRFDQIYHTVLDQVELVNQRQTYARDVRARYPDLGSLPKPGLKPLWPITVEQVEKLVDPVIATETAGSQLTLLIPLEEISQQCYWLYDSQVITESSLARIAAQFSALLKGIVDQPHQPLAYLPLLPEDERRRVLVEWNQTEADYPPDRCLHHLFEAQAERTPEAIAVVLPSRPGFARLAEQAEGRLTYQELNRRANQLAHYLRALGVGPGMTVGICVERSLEMMIGLLGILKAGGAYVPLDPAYPPERLAFILSEIQAPVLLTQHHLAGRLAGSTARVVYLDTEWATIAQENEENPVSEVTAQHLAYVIYTSGSTGWPKGVQIAHHSVINLIKNARPRFGFNERDVWTVFHSYAFDFSVWEIWTPLLCGSRLVIVPLEVTRSPAAFYDLLCREEVTVLNQTPSAIRQLLEVKADAVGELKLRLLMCGGEALPQELALALLEWQIPLWNFYGPTEATVWAAVQPVTSPLTTALVSIGRPLPNTQLYILDPYLQPVPVGVPGELHIAGVGLAQGYFNRPELTAEKFIPNPFEQSRGDACFPVPLPLSPLAPLRLYKSGDLARYLPDGSIEFLGRLDHQIKIRGFRVELGEIETALNQHPAVQENVVVASEDKPGDKRLIAYLVLKQAVQPIPSALISQLRHFLQSKLPDYMVPAIFIRLDALPLSPNGKVDRRALPAPRPARSESAETFVAPRTPTEIYLANIWAEVLGLEQVGIYDNFFELGGQSLLATRFISRLRHNFQLELPLRALFEAPTIAGLAKHIDTLQSAIQVASPLLQNEAGEDREEGEI